jgi:long-chain fatty acid transport protein
MYFMRTNRILSAALVACGAIGLTTTAHATNGYQLIGIGAYQKGMGGAVTANPGSAMTAITNPAGMAAIGSRADYSMELFMPERTTDFTGTDTNPAVATSGDKVESDAEAYGVPAVGWTAPVSDGSDFYFGGGMYGTSGLGADYAVTEFGNQQARDPNTGQPVEGPQMDFSGYSNIAFWQAAPTLAWKASDRLKLGISANLDYQQVAFQQSLTGARDRNNNPFNINFNLAKSAQTFGYGVSLGALYDVSEMVTVGVSYKSPQEFSESEFNLRENDIQNFPNGNGGLTNAQGGTYELDLDYPQQAALGVKFQPVDRLKVSADIKWIEWSETLGKLKVTGDFDNGNAALDPGWDNQVVYAVGVDFEAIPNKLNLRAGFNYAETPIEKQDVFSNLIFPAMVESHFSVGASYRINDHWDLSFAYMKAFENDETGRGDVPEGLQNAGFGADSGTKIDLEEDSYSLNLGYRF